jgi:hypothetical protein
MNFFFLISTIFANGGFKGAWFIYTIYFTLAVKSEASNFLCANILDGSILMRVLLAQNLRLAGLIIPRGEWQNILALHVYDYVFSEARVHCMATMHSQNVRDSVSAPPGSGIVLLGTYEEA